MRIFIQHPPSVKTSLEKGKKIKRERERGERKRKKEKKKERERNNMNVTTQTEGNLTACFIKIMPITRLIQKVSTVSL